MNVAGGTGVAVAGMGVDVGAAVGTDVAVGTGVDVGGLGVAVGMAVGVRVAVGTGVAVAGLGVAVGTAVGTDVAVGTGVAVAGTGVAVGTAVGADVAVGTGVAVGGAVGTGVGVAGVSSIVMTYVLKCVSVDTAHTVPEASVSHRCSSIVHSPSFTQYTRTRPSSHADASADGSANRRSTPREYVIGTGVVLPDANVSTSAASVTRSESAGGAPGESASNLVTCISTFDAAPAGTTTCTVESPVVISVSSFAVTGALADVGEVTTSVANTIRGVFSAPGALMVIWPRCVPAASPEAFADTLTDTRACGLFDDAVLGENDNQLASDDRVNGMSVSRIVFHTVNVCAAGLSPPCAAVNVRKFDDRPTSGRITSGVAVAVGVDVGAGTTSPPSPPVGVGGMDVAVGVGVGVAVGAGAGVVS